MAGEVYIDHVPPVLDGLVGKRLGEQSVFGQLCDLPDDVVAYADAVKDLIRTRVTALNPVKQHFQTPRCSF